MKKNLAGYLILASILGFFAFLSPHEHIWDGEGIVSLFPRNSSSKNYRLPAEIEVTKNGYGWFIRNETYKVNYVNWSNGGQSYFNECFVEKGSSSMCSTDDETYTVEVNETPAEPDNSSGYDY